MVLFSHPKPFTPETRNVQITAIRSWRHFLPECQILLFGNAEKLPELCRDERIHHGGEIDLFPNTEKPILSRFFQKIERDYPHTTKIFLNSDIVLGPGTAECLKRLQELPGSWLASARRRCFPPFCGSAREPGENRAWLENPEKTWSWGPPDAIDIFIYRELNLEAMPDFLVGHCAWDNWMIFNARSKGIPVIDSTADLPIYHFDHDYGYSKGNTDRERRAGPLEARNLQLLGGEAKRFHLGHATHELRGGILKKKGGSPVWQRKLELWRIQHPRWEWTVKILRSAFHPLVRAWEKNTAAREFHFR